MGSWHSTRTTSYLSVPSSLPLLLPHSPPPPSLPLLLSPPPSLSLPTSFPPSASFYPPSFCSSPFSPSFPFILSSLPSSLPSTLSYSLSSLPLPFYSILSLFLCTLSLPSPSSPPPFLLLLLLLSSSFPPPPPTPPLLLLPPVSRCQTILPPEPGLWPNPQCASVAQPALRGLWTGDCGPQDPELPGGGEMDGH